MKTQNQYALLFVVLVIGVLFLAQQGIISLPGFAVFPSTGAQFIPDSSNPSSEFSNITSSSRYTCDADECIVSGSMEVSKPLGVTKYACICSSTTCSVQTSGGTNTFDNKFTSADTLYDTSSCLNSNNLKQCPNHCNEVTSQKYEATFNFCPSVNPNFAYCTGSLNLVSSSEVKTYFTEETKLIRGESIEFAPKYSDNSAVVNKFIRIKKFDLSCLPAIEDGNACSSEQFFCSPTGSTSQCPTGYEKVTGLRSYNTPTGSVNSNCPVITGEWCAQRVGTLSRTCSDGAKINEYKNFIAPSGGIEYNKYKKCESSVQISQSTCNAFGTQIYTADTGKVCIVDSTGQTGLGVGKLQCPTSPCSIGERQKISTSSYQECKAVGTCEGWSSTIDCPSGLIFDENAGTQGQCVIPPENVCNPQEAECVGNLIRSCQFVNIGGVTGYVWSNEATQCLGELKCSQSPSTFDASCSCTGVSEAKVNPQTNVKCLTPTTYLVYSKDPLNTNSCFSYRDTTPADGINGVPVGQYEQCTNNQVVQRTDVGCAYGDQQFLCSTQKDTNNILYEQCIQNVCSPAQDNFTATESDFIGQKTRCSNSGIQEVKKYIGNNAISYRWETKTDAPNSNLGICKTDFLCVELLNGQAQCSLGAQFVGIIAEDNYAIGEKINDVLVSLTNEVPDKANKQITARLLENGVEISGTRINTFTDSQGRVELDFNYASTKITALKIEVTAGNPAGTSYVQTRDIQIKSTLNLILVCPVQAYVDREAVCTWKVQNVETGNLVDASPKIKVTQGINDLAYQPKGTSSVSFTSPVSGSVKVVIEVNKEGFIGDTSEATVTVQPLTQSQFLEIDNKDFFTYAGSGITTGTHQLALKVLDSSGQIEDVQSILATIRTPSGQEFALSFNQGSDGRFITSYNFQQAGNTYNVKGNVLFEDLTKESLPFEYSVVTTGSGTEEDKNMTFLLIATIGVVVLGTIGTIVYLLTRRKKRR